MTKSARRWNASHSPACECHGCCYDRKHPQLHDREAERLATLQTLRTCGQSLNVPTAIRALGDLPAGDIAAIRTIYPTRSTRELAVMAVRLHENTTVAGRVVERQFAGMATRRTFRPQDHHVIR